MIFGIAGLIARRISYASHQSDVQVGSLHATVETRRVVEFPPLLCVVVILGGALVSYISWKKL